MASGFAAGGGADMLQEVLRRKFTEALAQQKLQEDIRQANMQHQVQQGQLGLGQQRLGQDQEQLSENRRQFDEQAPVRMANATHLGAETEALNRAPTEAEKTRSGQAAMASQQQSFTGGQNDLNRQNARTVAGINGQNAMSVAKLRAAAGGGNPQTQQNEVDDSLALIDQITNDPALATAVGPIDQYVGKARDLSGVNRFEALNNQLVGKLSLAQAGKLKGQGQISDKERALLRDAATALSRGLSEKDYKNELAKIRSQFERMKVGGAGAPAVGAGAPVEFDFVPGKGLVPRKPK